MDGQAGIQIDIQKDIRTERQVDTQTERHTEILADINKQRYRYRGWLDIEKEIRKDRKSNA